MGQMLSNLGTKDNPLSWKTPLANKPSFLKPKRMKQTVVSEQGEPEYSERQKMISSWDMRTENMVNSYWLSCTRVYVPHWSSLKMAVSFRSALQKCTHWKTLIVKVEMSGKWRGKTVNQETPCVCPFTGYCSCSDTNHSSLFFEKE